jgi:hypothetical protein
MSENKNWFKHLNPREVEAAVEIAIDEIYASLERGLK